MYWGLVLKTNKRYSQQITKGFHVSNATLDLHSIEKDAALSVWVHTDDSDHLLCNLNKQIPQVSLDLVFSEGETVAFYSKGSGTIHLNGNIIQDDDFETGDMVNMGDEELDEEVEDEETDYAALKKALKKEKLAKNGKKSSEAEKEDSEEDSNDDVEDELEDEDSDEDDDLDDDEEEDDMSDDDEDDMSDDDEKEQMPPSKKGKMETKQNGVTTNGKLVQKDEQGKKKKGMQQEQSKTEKKEQKTGKKTLAGGVNIEDLHLGKGPEATAGKRVTVYYIGRLQKTNKVFDSCQSGEGFKFHLGKNEVIRGWDVGVVGMRVGGKRRIVCPPHTAYGAKGAPPAIPGNATLVFDVTLRAIV